jgi:hypothetical protein
VGLLSFVTLIAFSSDAALAATTLNLGSASSYAVLAGSTITNTGTSVISGDVGLYPGTSVTGFSSVTLTGAENVANAAAQGAEGASTAAYLVAKGETPTTKTETAIAGATTLTPGIYTASSALSVGGTLTLNGGGDADAVFIFQAGSTLITASSTSVVLEGGAQACNVFWQVGSSATLGTSTSFVGSILALTSATLDTGATVNGRVQAQTGAVTLDGNTITVPSCSATTPTTTTTAVGTTTTTAAGGTTTTHPVTTTTHPKSTTTTKPSTSPGGTTSTIIPVGAPATGEGGTAGSGSSPLGLIGLGAFGVAMAAASIAVRTRRRHG